MKKHSQLSLVCAAAALLVGAATAGAEVIYFENPAPGQPGHYDWVPPAGDVTHWLDITLPATAQPGVEGPTSFQQRNYSDAAGKLFSGALTAYFAAGGVHESQLWPAQELDMIPAEGPLPPDYNWRWNAFVYEPAYGTNFTTGAEEYVGVRFDLTDNGIEDYQYGWIGVIYDGDIALDAFAWGYETEVGVPIEAGVPEPGSLALMALGAVGVMTRRRRA